MIVEQIEAFKIWLTAVLKPMCEADPAALAKYVLALIKKDKSQDELRKSMVGQLDVFLEGETETFVNLVFETLENKEYIKNPPIPNTNPPNPNIKAPAKENKVVIEPNDLPDLNESINGEKKDLELKRDREIRKTSDSEKDDKPLRPRIRVHSPIPRNRSRTRSRSWDRSKRSRSPREKSRDRSREREQHRLERDKRERPRSWRNKSNAWRNRSPTTWERRSRTISPNRLRSRSRSPRHHRRYRRNTGSRSRSRSPDKRERRDSLKDKDLSKPGTPTPDSNSENIDSRSTQMSSVVVSQNNKRRCRDFDEKGYCMRGEMCPYDHGMDPVVLEDAQLSRVLTYNPNGGPMEPRVPPPMMNPVGMMGPRPIAPEYNPQAPQMWNRGGGGGFRPRGMGPVRMPSVGMFPNQPPNMQRELIPVPVISNPINQPTDPFYPPNFQQNPNPYQNHHPDNHAFKKKNFDFNRLGAANKFKNPLNCSLELKKVPVGLNSITHLNNHFSKFGKIVNIQVQYEGDAEGALVTFSSHAEANAAYRSTEAVLNNRFIKVFWHNNNPENKQENVPPRSVKDRLGSQNNVPPNINKVLNLVQPVADVKTEAVEEKPAVKEENEKEKAEIKQEAKAQATAAIIKNQELLAAKEQIKKNQDEKRKDVLKINNDLRKRKQELLEKQIKQQKMLIDKIAKIPAGPQRDKILETIKKSQESIEAIKKDIEQSSTSKTTAPAKKTKEDTQRELLDMELDLISKQQEGQDTSELQRRLLELRTRVSQVRGGRGRGRGATRYPTPVIGRHLLTKNNKIDNTKLKTIAKTLSPGVAANTTFQKTTVDHRPTRLLVSGYETDEQEGVQTHFQQYGEISDFSIDNTLPSTTITYKTRKEAENAMLKGKHFQDRTLSITWCNSLSINNNQTRLVRTPSVTSVKVTMSESEEDQLIDTSLLDGDDELAGPEIAEEVLLQDDEEDEDEESRSWRR